MSPFAIRQVQNNDIESIAKLCGQLGYVTKTEDLPQRLKQISETSHHMIYVADLDHQVVGWIHVYLCPLLIYGSQAQLGGMVVHEEHRSKGIGKKLLLQAETWARSKGCQYLTVFSNITRSETHKFYSQSGYQNLKTEFVLQKHL